MQHAKFRFIFCICDSGEHFLAALNLAAGTLHAVLRHLPSAVPGWPLVRWTKLYLNAKYGFPLYMLGKAMSCEAMWHFLCQPGSESGGLNASFLPVGCDGALGTKVNRCLCHFRCLHVQLYTQACCAIAVPLLLLDGRSAVTLHVIPSPVLHQHKYSCIAGSGRPFRAIAKQGTPTEGVNTPPCFLVYCLPRSFLRTEEFGMRSVCLRGLTLRCSAASRERLGISQGGVSCTGKLHLCASARGQQGTLHAASGSGLSPSAAAAPAGRLRVSSMAAADIAQVSWVAACACSCMRSFAGHPSKPCVHTGTGACNFSMSMCAHMCACCLARELAETGMVEDHAC